VAILNARAVGRNHVSTRAHSADLGLLLLRLFAGLALAFAHGIHKLPPSGQFVQGVAEMGFPVPLFFAWASTAAELGGGLLIALGLFVRPAALLVSINMLVAIFLRQAGDPFAERELAALYLAVALALLFTGSGRYGLDNLLRRRPHQTPNGMP
jgi:putative oxidoreductase